MDMKVSIRMMGCGLFVRAWNVKVGTRIWVGRRTPVRYVMPLPLSCNYSIFRRWALTPFSYSGAMDIVRGFTHGQCCVRPIPRIVIYNYPMIGIKKGCFNLKLKQPLVIELDTAVYSASTIEVMAILE